METSEPKFSNDEGRVYFFEIDSPPPYIDPYDLGDVRYYSPKMTKVRIYSGDMPIDEFFIRAQCNMQKVLQLEQQYEKLRTEWNNLTFKDLLQKRIDFLESHQEDFSRKVALLVSIQDAEASVVS